MAQVRGPKVESLNLGLRVVTLSLGKENKPRKTGEIKLKSWPCHSILKYKIYFYQKPFIFSLISIFFKIGTYEINEFYFLVLI